MKESNLLVRIQLPSLYDDIMDYKGNCGYFFEYGVEDLQEIVLLRFGQELTLREIAQVLQMPLRTVQTRLRRALKVLKTEIASSEEIPADRKTQDL